MWPFKRRNQNQSDVPKEVQDYYQSERRERTGIAWLLALATLAVTVVLAILLFFGGRWVYRTFFDGNGQTGPATSQPDQNQGQNGEDGVDAPALPGDDATNGQDGTADENGDTGTEQQTPQTTPPAGPSSDLPRTGPVGELY